MTAFQQRDASDCGASCLAYVLHHYGLAVSVAVVRQKAGTDQIGTTALGLVETARAFGCEAKGVKCQFEHLAQVGLPAIAHVVVDGKRQHYVVVTRIGRQRVHVMDPAIGQIRKWSAADFQQKWTNVLVMLAPGLQFEPGQRTKSALQRLWTMLCAQRTVLCQAFVGAVLGTVLSLGGAIFVQKIVDNVIPDGNRNLLNLLGLGMVVILAVRLVLGYFQSVLVLRAAQKIDATLILGYYRHLLHLPQSFFDTMRIGEINSRIGDAVQIRNFLNGTLVSLVLNPLILLFSLSMMFVYSWKLALLSLALIPCNGLVYLAADWRNRRYQRVIMERSSEFSAQLVESMHAMPIVRGFRLESTMALKIEARLVRLLRTTWNAAYLNVIVGSAGTVVTQLFSILLLWIGASLVLDADLTAGQLMSCQALANYLITPMLGLIGMNASIRQALAATDRLYEVMDLERERDAGTVELGPGDLSLLRFEAVNFKYPGRLATLHNISLTIKAGEITVLFGPSGCGKSTLLALLHRIHRPDTGRIVLGDVEIEQATLQSLRALISIVPQRVDLLSGTIVENLAPGDPQPDMRRLVTLCREVGILDFITGLPRGFDTVVTEGGTNLSGGQRQRLAIVRALYLAAPVILLDEPSSSLDPHADDQLMKLLIGLRNEGKTVVIAAHSPRVLQIADVAIELANGKIVSVRRRPPIAEASPFLRSQPVGARSPADKELPVTSNDRDVAAGS